MESKIDKVTVIDIKMPFFSMMIFMIKWAIAAIPAFIIIGIIASALFGIFGVVVNNFKYM